MRGFEDYLSNGARFTTDC